MNLNRKIPYCSHTLTLINSDPLPVSACLVLREPGGETSGAGDSVAAHPGPVAGDCGEDGASGEEDDLQGPPAPPQQPNTVTWASDV